ncbi:MAG: hypothetical protein U0531_09815 [Dehalococcoidia bacterium]
MKRVLVGLALGLALGAAATLALFGPPDSEPRGRPTSIAPPEFAPDISVTFSLTLLSALVQQAAERADAPISMTDVRVEAARGALLVRGNITVAGHGAAGVIPLEPTVEDGRLRMRVRDARLGPFPAPPRLERLVEAPVNARIESVLAGLPATITGAAVSDEGLTVTARTQLDEPRRPRPER